MVFSLLYMVLRAVFRLAPAGDQRDREVEILVLRQQVGMPPDLGAGASVSASS
ncbi:MAG TPA: hypothetical protein VFH61_12605 [Thermoleophilia bacterium]|nr:hypothetical protein [Thermoleophilia bacterium]